MEKKIVLAEGKLFVIDCVLAEVENNSDSVMAVQNLC